MSEELTFEECLQWSENYQPVDTSNKQFWTVIGGLAATSAVIAGAGYMLSSNSSNTPQIANGGPPPNPPNASVPNRQDNNRREEQEPEPVQEPQIVEQSFKITSPPRNNIAPPVAELISPGSIITGDDGLQYEIVE